MSATGLMAQGTRPTGPAPPPVPLPHPEISPPDFPAVTITPWWLVVLGILMGLGLLALLVWYALLPKPVKAPSLQAPLKRAMESLQSLRGRVQEMAPSEVAHDVSLIIRTYLQHSYAVPAPYRTTEEIYNSPAMSTREPLKHRFEPVAVFYDQVEFAPHPRTVADSEGLVDSALEVLAEEQRLMMAQPALITSPVFRTNGPPPLPPRIPPPVANP
ncbi:MAG TPA: hypothetical protein VLE43_07570 [Candidatus Saccharimonadia bacterium]|nr:hypothetical protein [Candidatus Saccharimonadia bacterium]